MATAKLTDRGIAATTFAGLDRDHAKANPLRETDPVQHEVWDALSPGLALRVTRRMKVWTVRYRANGSNRRMTLGKYPVLSLADARSRARGIMADAAAGLDPQLEKATQRAHDVTFAAMAREVLDAKKRGTRPSTQKEREDVLRKWLLPAWRTRPASSITRRDVVLLIERVARSSPVRAGKVLAVVRVLFNEGLRRGFHGVESNPAHLLQPPARPAVQTRFLEKDELKAVWTATADGFLVTRCFFRFLILTAQRDGATRAMRWSDIVGDVWRTPAPVFKGDRDHLTPLSAEALAVLDEVKSLTGDNEYVFAGRDGGRRRSVRQAFLRTHKRAGIPAWTPHDIRRTFRTHAARAVEDGGLGVEPAVADLVLGHSERTLGFTRYAGDRERYRLAERRDALAKWGRFVTVAVEVNDG